MTLASRFSSIGDTRSRLTPTGSRRNRSRAFHRRASFEALENRRLLATVSFTNAGETVDESTGTCTISLTLSNDVSTVGFDWPGPVGLAFDSAGNLYISGNNGGTVIEVPKGGGPFKTIASGFDLPAGLARLVAVKTKPESADVVNPAAGLFSRSERVP